MMKNITLFLALMIFIQCCKRPCINNHIDPAFIGFSLSDIDTLVIRYYKANDNFQHLIDTMLIKPGPPVYTTSNDTIFVHVGGAGGNNGDPHHWIVPGYDWQVYIPARNRTITISNINSPQTEQAGRVCYNPINSFDVDGQAVVAEYVKTNVDYTSGYRVYIHN